MPGTARMPRKAVAVLVAASALGTVTTGLAPAASASTPATARPAAQASQKGPYTLEYNKAVTVRVLKGIFERADMSVIDRYIRPDYIQHNAQAADGTQALKNFAIAQTRQFPDMKYNIKRIFAQGDLVIVHSNVVFTPGTRGLAIVDIYRFEKGLIAEHWDVVQEVPETTVSGNDMFSTVSSPRTNRPGPHWRTGFSKKLVTAYFNRLMVDKDPSAVEYLAPEYHQHNPTIPSGSAGLREQFTAFFRQFPNLIVEPKRVIAEGDLVAVHAHYRLNPSDRGQAVVDIFRVRGGKIVEHWDVIQDVPATSANDNTMF